MYSQINQWTNKSVYYTSSAFASHIGGDHFWVGGGGNCCRFCWSFLNCAKTIKAINLKVYHFSWKWSEYIFWIFKNVWSNFWSCKYMFTSLLWKYVIDVSSTFHLRKTEKKNFFCQEFSKRHKILGFTAVSRNGLHIWWCR